MITIISNFFYTVLATVFYIPMSISPLLIKIKNIPINNGINIFHQNLTTKDLVISHIEGFLFGYVLCLVLFFFSSIFSKD